MLSSTPRPQSDPHRGSLGRELPQQASHASGDGRAVPAPLPGHAGEEPLAAVQAPVGQLQQQGQQQQLGQLWEGLGSCAHPLLLSIIRHARLGCVKPDHVTLLVVWPFWEQQQQLGQLWEGVGSCAPPPAAQHQQQQCRH